MLNRPQNCHPQLSRPIGRLCSHSALPLPCFFVFLILSCFFSLSLFFSILLSLLLSLSSAPKLRAHQRITVLSSEHKQTSWSHDCNHWCSWYSKGEG